MSKHQRRKGNAQAASSAHAAELLTNSGHTVQIGLKELRHLIDKTSIDDVRKSFKHFVVLFPNLSVDATAAIRFNAVRVLGGYIKKLQKGSEPYLKRGEGEETEEQRFMRLALQSLQYLHSICTESLSEELRKRILQFFSSSHLKRLVSPSSQVVSSVLILARRMTTLTDGWETVLKSCLPTVALAHLDNADRSTSRASALLILEMVKAKVLFSVLDIDEAVVRRMISLISRKRNFWNNISAIIVPVIKAVLEEKTVAESKVLLEKILNSFFEGMPWDMSFPNVAWVNTFIEFMEFRISWTMNRYVNDLDVVVDEMIPKMWIAAKHTLKWNDSSLVRKIVHLPERIVNICCGYPEIVSRLRCQFQEHLLSELPSSEPLIEELFCDIVEPVWSNFIEQLLTHTCASQKLIASVIEKCNDDILKDLNSRIDLCQTISSKIDWKTVEGTALLMLKLLIKFAAMFGKQIIEFYEVGDELTSIRFLIAFGLLNEEKYSAIHFVDELILVNAMQFCVHQADLERWNIVMNIATMFPYFETALQQVLVENRCQIDQQFLTTVLNKLGREISEDLRNKLVNLIVGHFFEVQEPSSEVINETVKAMVSSNVDMKSVAQIIVNKLNAIDLLQSDYSGIEISTAIAASLPLSSATHFIISSTDLVDKFAVLDKKYGLEIIDALECLGAPVVKSLIIENVDNNSTLLSHLNYAIFIINYLNMVAEEHIEHCTTNFLYAVGILSVASINTICNERLTDIRTYLNNLVKQLILANERLREDLLSECISLIAEGNESLCLFAALRLLADGLCVEKIENIFKAFVKNLDFFEIMLCSSALRFQDAGKVCDVYRDPPIYIRHWISHFEMASSLEDSTNLLQLFAHYGTEEDEERNLFNCALLRFLINCCPYVQQMDTAMRDFLCCALITSLESANALWGQCKSQSYILFSGMSVRLFSRCAQMIDNIKDVVDLSSFKQDWSDFFCPTAQNILFIWFLGLTSYQENFHSIALRNALSLSMNYITEEFIRTASLQPVFDVELDLLNYDEHLQSVVIPLHALISFPFADVQIAALRIFKLVLDGSTLGSSVLSPKLLIWDAFISSLNQFELLEKVAYCSTMGPYMDQIMPHLFGLLPDSSLNVSSVGVMDITKQDYWKEMKSLVPRYAFRLFYNTCRILPAIVRQWYIKLPRAGATIFKSFVTKSVSPLIWKAECDQFAARKMPNKLKVRLLRAARQIVAEYDLEDSIMILTIEYPVDYPLSNGSIVDAVLMWAGNIERHMEGAEDCTICMMTVHSRTYQLPRVRCKQCKSDSILIAL
ncbi:hypothetical protein DINM_022549 [Dirofilaria immitis]|nr:hypothetical protein [Dirofilaria immitis]